MFIHKAKNIKEHIKLVQCLHGWEYKDLSVSVSKAAGLYRKRFSAVFLSRVEITKCDLIDIEICVIKTWLIQYVITLHKIIQRVCLSFKYHQCLSLLPYSRNVLDSNLMTGWGVGFACSSRACWVLTGCSRFLCLCPSPEVCCAYSSVQESKTHYLLYKFCHKSVTY